MLDTWNVFVGSVKFFLGGMENQVFLEKALFEGFDQKIRRIFSSQTLQKVPFFKGNLIFHASKIFFASPTTTIQVSIIFY